MSANERKESGRLLGLSTRAAQLLQRLKTFMDEKVYPAEKVNDHVTRARDVL